MGDIEDRDNCKNFLTDQCDDCPCKRDCLGVDIWEQDDLEYYNDCEADDYRDEGEDCNE